MRSTEWLTAQSSRWGGRNVRRNKPAIVQPTDNGNGYKTVMLRVGGRSTRFYVHRMILEAFVSLPPTEAHQAAHWNGVRDDNRLENLRWATPAENHADIDRHGTRRGPARRSHCPAGHPYTGDNLRLDQDGHNICVTCMRAAVRKNHAGESISPTRRRPLPKAVREAVATAANGACATCAGSLIEYEIDHILAVHLGGGDELSNLRALCIACHLDKSRRETKERAKADRIRTKRAISQLMRLP